MRSFTPQAPPPPAALTNLDVNPATVVGGNASSGTVIVSVAAPDATVISLSSSNPAVAERAGDRHGADERLHRHVHDHDLRRSGQHDRS